MDDIQNDDRTLASEAWGAWSVAALESGVDHAELRAITIARMRLLGAAAMVTEAMGEQAEPACIAEVLRHIRELRARPAYNLYWTADDKP